MLEVGGEVPEERFEPLPVVERGLERLHDMAGLGIVSEIVGNDDEAAVPVRDPVRGACELLGLDPLHIANEGKLIAFVPEACAGRALAALRTHPLGRHAARIGAVTEAHPGVVELITPVRGRRLLDLPFAEPLPRIC